MGEDSPPARARRQAEAWIARFAAAGASPAELRDFRAWLRGDDNKAAWAAVAAGRARRSRYVVRPAGDRFRVVDMWTGATAIIAMTPQDGLSEADAAHTAKLLNRRVEAQPQAPLQS